VAVVPGGIFISYRRQETSDLAGRLYDRLADRFGEDQVFMDVDTIELGVDFAEVITSAVATCEVLLAVIGPHWLTAADKHDRRRLDDPDDIVRLEVEAALDREVRVIPILVGGAVMPQRGELPDSLAKLARRNGLNVRHDSFRSDVARLVTAIERIVAVGPPDEAPLVAEPAVRRDVRPAPVHVALEAVRVLRHTAASTGVAFSPDGQWLATGSLKVARVWDVASGHVRARLTHGDMVWGVAFSPDGELVATACMDKRARLWEVASGHVRALAHDDAVWGVAFSPDGRLVATTGENTTARVWDVASGQEHTRLSHSRIGISGVAFSPDGQLLATAGDDTTARVWEVASGQEILRLAHDDEVWGVAFSPDGQLLATSSKDRTARLWEASGQERARLAHGDAVWGVAFSPDSKLVATGCLDKRARVWEVASGQERARLTLGAAVPGVAFSPDGQLLATTGLAKRVRLWEVRR
jgi:dipeptidyl aminopeptidase/acylaminoacyl peptidase